jgi:ABC-type antimicrobial peptide transport system permease subunit
MIALAGGVGGCLLAFGTVGWIRQIPIFYIQGMTLPPAVIAITLGAAVAIGVASSLAPALGAARMTITESLRHTG